MAEHSHDPGYQAYRILQVTFIIAPLIAGLDKFFYLLADWTAYLSPIVTQITSLDKRSFLIIVGIVEIIGAIGVLWKPWIFAYVISVWILLVIINLLVLGNYFDIALRDMGLMLSAFALGKLSSKYRRLSESPSLRSS